MFADKAILGVILMTHGTPGPASARSFPDPTLEAGAIRRPIIAGTGMASQWNYFFDAMIARPELDRRPAAPLPDRKVEAPGAATQPLSHPSSVAPGTRGRFASVPSPDDSLSYSRTFRILLAHPDITDRYDPMITAAAERFNLDARLLKAIIAAESEFARGAVSPSGALGLMQVMPVTAEEMGIPRGRLFDPQSNVTAGAAYLHELFRMAWRRYRIKSDDFRNAPIWLVKRVIAAYNAGPRFLTRRPWYHQTRLYVEKVGRFYDSRVADLRAPQNPDPVIAPFLLERPKG